MAKTKWKEKAEMRKARMETRRVRKSNEENGEKENSGNEGKLFTIDSTCVAYSYF